MAVAFDAASSSSPSGVSNSFSWAHTCSGSNRILVVSVFHEKTPDPAYSTTVTYDGVAMTRHGAIDVGGGGGSVDRIEAFYLVAPAAGSKTVAVTISASVDRGYFAGLAVSINGAAQAAPTDVQSAQNAATDHITDSVTIARADSLVVTTAGHGLDTSVTMVPDHGVERLDVGTNQAGGGRASMGTQVEAGVGSASVGWSSDTSQRMNIYALVFPPPLPPPPPGNKDSEVCFHGPKRFHASCGIHG